MSDRVVRVGADIGGTFTDLVLVDPRDGSVRLGKTLTTPANLMDGVVNGLGELLARTGHAMSNLANVVHGTTIVTNALIERKGVRVGLITTAGARDALEMGREFRYDIYDLALQRPEPLVPRHLRMEVTERLSVDGEVLRPLDLSSLDEIIDTFRQHGVEAVAIVLLHSYVNAEHEQALAAAVAARFPEAVVTSSAELVPVMREFERTSTTVANAYVQPIVQRYVRDLESQLVEDGLQGPLYIMLSSGGLTPAADAAEAPIQLIESGPAGGAMAARYVGERLGEPNLLSFDMGGTTAKMCLIDAGVPMVAHEFETARVHRFKKGSGLPLKIPVIEMIEIGAGGGSIASLNAMGLLQVGPHSAGADPGPAAYGLGGIDPTVTDADILLGYLDPDWFLGGTMSLDRGAAASALERKVAPGLDRDVLGAAAAVKQTVDEDMANATRLYVAERGRDLRSYTMFAFGGAGPVHAYRVAQLLGLRRLIFPYGAGTLSALGFLVAPIRVEFVATSFSAVDRIDWSHIRSMFADLEGRGRASLAELDVAPEDVTLLHSVEMRFRGQGYEVAVDFPPDVLESGDTAALEARFHAVYRELFSRVPEGVPAEVLTWRLVAQGPVPVIDLEFEPGGEQRVSTDPVGSRPVYFPEVDDFVESSVYRRSNLPTGAHLQGPAVIEEAQSTAVVGPGATIHVDDDRNLVVDLP